MYYRSIVVTAPWPRSRQKIRCLPSRSELCSWCAPPLRINDSQRAAEVTMHALRIHGASTNGHAKSPSTTDKHYEGGGVRLLHADKHYSSYQKSWIFFVAIIMRLLMHRNSTMVNLSADALIRKDKGTFQAHNFGLCAYAPTACQCSIAPTATLHTLLANVKSGRYNTHT